MLDWGVVVAVYVVLIVLFALAAVAINEGERLLEPEPYRATGSNTLRASLVLQTVKPKTKPPSLKRKVAVHG